MIHSCKSAFEIFLFQGAIKPAYLSHMLVRFCLLVLGATVIDGSAAISTWEPLDLELQAAQNHAWWEFPVTATFLRKNQPEEPALKVEGFWDGGNAWRIRTTFPKPGTWQWRTESADPGLDGKTGTIEVISPTQSQTSANPNLRGQLRVASDHRHFEYADGTPVFLLASTLWAANTARCGLGQNEDGPFYQHLADRKAKGFNTILMQYFHGYGDYPDSPGHRNEGGKPYFDIQTKALNPAFFQVLDIRMQALWENGFLVAIPTTWWGKTNNCVFTPEDAKHMSTYCAVRYGAFNAIWSLSGEYQYAFKDCGWTPEDINLLGKSVQEHNPLKRPLSIHPSGRTNWDPPHDTQSSLPFHDQVWLDHHWLQTGQSRDRLHYMISRPAETRALEPPVPVFLSEAFYERPDDPEGAYTSRWQVWTSLIQGTCGFGYGAFGLWQFYDPDDPQGETGKFTGREVPWWEAQQFQGSSEVQHVKAALNQLDWWKLEPAMDRIVVDGKPGVLPTAEDISPPQAASVGKDTWFVYIPRGNASKTIELTGVKSGHWSGTWIDPRTGAQFPSGQITRERNTMTLPKLPLPQAEDWVFLAKTVLPE